MFVDIDIVKCVVCFVCIKVSEDDVICMIGEFNVIFGFVE